MPRYTAAMATSILLNNELSRFEIYLDGELAGFAEFKLRDGKMALPHTEIDPKFGGQGLGSALIQYALDDAAIKKLLVAPYCPFVSKIHWQEPR